MFLDYLLRLVHLIATSNRQDGTHTLFSEGWGQCLALLTTSTFCNAQALEWYSRHKAVIQIRDGTRTYTDFFAPIRYLPVKILQNLKTVYLHVPHCESVMPHPIIGRIARIWGTSHCLKAMTIRAPPCYDTLPALEETRPTSQALSPLVAIESISSKIRWDLTDMSGDSRTRATVLDVAVREKDSNRVAYILEHWLDPAHSETLMEGVITNDIETVRINPQVSML